MLAVFLVLVDLVLSIMHVYVECKDNMSIMRKSLSKTSLNLPLVLALPSRCGSSIVRLDSSFILLIIAFYSH